MTVEPPLMRALISVLLLAGCSSSQTGAPSKSGAGQPQGTPRPAAAQLTLPGSNPGAFGGTGGGSGDPATPVATAVSTPNDTVRPGRKPPIEPGLSRMPGYQASLNVVNTVTPESNSLARGFKLYQQACAMCHGEDLHGQPGPATEQLRDLTHSNQYRFGSTDQALYRTLVYGIPKSPMGNYKHVFQPEQVWDLINFIHSKRID